MGRVPHGLIEGCLIAAYAIGADAVFIYVRGEYRTSTRCSRRRADEARARHGLPRPDFVVRDHLHRGAGAYICGEETGADREPRGQARPPAAKAAVPADRPASTRAPTPSTTSRRSKRPAHRRPRRRVVRDDGHQRSTGRRDLLDLGERQPAGRLRAPLGHDAARAHRRASAAASRGAQLKAVIPGGSSGRCRRRRRSTTLRPRLDPGRRLDVWARPR